jgi:hypothetical protein
MHSDSLFSCGVVWQIGWQVVWIGGVEGGEYPILGIEPSPQIYELAAL